jgi:ribonuclease Z
MEFDVGGHEIRAVSVGGLETCIELPAWKLCFDIGRCPHTATRLPRVLFTHAHVDHMAGVIHHCATRDLLGMSQPLYVVPKENEEDFHAMLAAWRRLDRSDLPCTVQGARPGDRVEIGKSRHATAFRSVHRVPTIGWALSSRKRKLRADLVGVGRDEILRRRQAGEAVEDEVESVEVAFCGDTMIEVVERVEAVRTARVLILEVTFLDEKVPVELARSKGHVHLDEVIARAHLFRNEHIVFTHFSARYDARQIRRILDQKLPDSLRERVIPLLPEGHSF